MEKVFLIIRKKINLRILILLALFSVSFSNSQSVKLTGTITDLNSVPLSNANVIAEPLNNKRIEFSITNSKGEFSLKLNKQETYTINFSYLGYKNKSLRFNSQKDTLINIKLSENNQLLEEIQIDAKSAVTIKQDTITYLVNKFLTGNERKLKDILKKLPGVEIDKLGNIIANGKKITKVLVENKKFFNGGSKLAVENIPADAVKEIDIIDDYSEVKILKGLEESNETAMNVKLKEDKKKFWFGDLDLASGIKKRYLIHPSLFYYSPKTSSNIIGDFNNIGVKSFSFKDYLDFEGGYNKILLQPKVYFSKINDNFTKFLKNKDFNESKHSFIATNINQNLLPKTELLGYVILSNSNNQAQSITSNKYLTNNFDLEELRNTIENPLNKFVIGKLGIENSKDDNSKIIFNSFVKYSKNLNNLSRNSLFSNNNVLMTRNSKFDNLDLKQDLEWYKSISDKHTITSLMNFNIKDGEMSANWLSNNNIFGNELPLVYDTNYNVLKSRNTTSLNYTGLLKHYWTFNKYIHLYSTFGFNYYNDKYNSKELQHKTNGDKINFDKFNFGNNLNSKFKNTYLGSHFKLKLSKFNIKTGIFYQKYIRNLNQLNQVYNLNKTYILPDINVRVNLNRNEEINLNYRKKVRFPSIVKLIQRKTISGFNSTYIGNPKLENEIYNQIFFSYYKLNLSRKINYNFNFKYKFNKKGIRTKNTTNGINYLTTPILANNSNKNFDMSSSISKRIKDYNITLGGGK